MSLTWVLRFEFMAVAGGDERAAAPVGEAVPRVEPLLWELPLRVLVAHHPADLHSAPQFLFLA